MGLYKKFVNQTRKPEGFLGKMMVGGMNSGHAKLADWGMDHLDGIDASSIAELGCGRARLRRRTKYRRAAETLSEWKGFRA